MKLFTWTVTLHVLSLDAFRFKVDGVGVGGQFLLQPCTAAKMREDCVESTLCKLHSTTRGD